MIPPLLATRKLDSFYGDFQALFAVDLAVAAGEIVALVGANGAGKSTLLKTICGLLPAQPGAITFDGEGIGGLPTGQIVRRGIALVPGESYLTRLVFDLPEKVADPRLLVTESDWITRALIGHENSPLHRKTSFRLS